MLQIEDVWNWDDSDPLSLEPVPLLERPWPVRHRGKLYFYDPWMWLELACRQQLQAGKVVHPVWNSVVHLLDLVALRDVCSLSPHKSSAQQELLEQCDSKDVKIDKYFKEDGDLGGVHIYAKSPLLQVFILDHEFGSSTLSAGKPVRCRAVVRYSLADAHGRVLCSRCTYMGSAR